MIVAGRMLQIGHAGNVGVAWHGGGLHCRRRYEHRGDQYRED
jgi:hypothetical protein